MLITEFINSQFKKAGVEMSAEMKEALNVPELAKVNLDDTLVKNVNEKLMTLDVAKANPILKQYFKAESLDPIDKDINDKLLAEYEIPDDVALAIKSEKNTYSKIPLLLQTIKQLEAKKATATVGDKKVLVDKIDELDKIILSERQKSKLEKEALVAENINNEREWNIRGSFAPYDYSDIYERPTAIEIAMIELRKSLLRDGAKVILDKDKSLHLVNAADEALPFTRENQKVSYQEYIDKLVAEKKLIKTSDPQKQQDNPPNMFPGNPANPLNNNFEIPNVAQQDILNDLKNAMGNGMPVNN